MPFQIIRNDITKVRADAIVNTANPEPCVGAGTDKAIYVAAGEEALLAERKQIGRIAPGRAVSTGAYNLDAKYIIHTVGPAWIDGNHKERETLRSCYEKSLALAAKLKCKSIAFPLIATGVYGFPRGEALNIALSEIGKFLLIHEMKVILVVFDRKAMELSEELAGSIDQFLDEHSVERIRDEEYGGDGVYGERRRCAIDRERWEVEQRRMAQSRQQMGAVEEAQPKPMATAFPAPFEISLKDAIGSKGDTFQQRLFKLIDVSGMDDVTVYHKANIDRKVFSRIRCKPHYKPKKITAVDFAIALELDLPTTCDLLATAGIAFSQNDDFDLIISYFIGKKEYDIFTINAALFEYGQPTLGAIE